MLLFCNITHSINLHGCMPNIKKRLACSLGMQISISWFDIFTAFSTSYIDQTTNYQQSLWKDDYKDVEIFVGIIFTLHTSFAPILLIVSRWWQPHEQNPGQHSFSLSYFYFTVAWTARKKPWTHSIHVFINWRRITKDSGRLQIILDCWRTTPVDANITLHKKLTNDYNGLIRTLNHTLKL